MKPKYDVILITGKTGVGKSKELAKQLHRTNCATQAISP